MNTANSRFEKTRYSTGELTSEDQLKVRLEFQLAALSIESQKLGFANALLEVRESNRFTQWGFDTFHDFVSSECPLSFSSVKALMKVADVFGRQLNMAQADIEDIGWTKAHVISTHVQNAIENGDNPEQFLTAAKTLPLRKLRDFLKEASAIASPAADPRRLSALAQISAAILAAPKRRWPEKPAHFAVQPGDWRQLCFSMADSRNTLILGPSGSGKTEVATLCTAAFGRELHTFNFGAMSEPRTSLIGSIHFNPAEGTSFSASRFVRALQTPGAVILLDEINRCSPDAYNILIPLLDGQRKIALDEHPDSPLVELANHVCFIATANVGSEYVGAESIDKAIKDRFSTVIPLWFAPLSEEATVLVQRVRGLSRNDALKLCRFANRQRELWREGEFAEVISTRALLAAAAQIPIGISVKEAITYSVVNHFSDEGCEHSDRTKLLQLLQRLG